MSKKPIDVTPAEMPEDTRYLCTECGRTEWGREEHYPRCGCYKAAKDGKTS
jgi:hypothetical protein